VFVDRGIGEQPLDGLDISGGRAGLHGGEPRDAIPRYDLGWIRRLCETDCRDDPSEKLNPDVTKHRKHYVVDGVGDSSRTHRFTGSQTQA